MRIAQGIMTGLGGMLVGAGKGLVEKVSSLSFGTAAKTAVIGTASLGTAAGAGYVGLEIEEAFRGQNSALGRAKQNEADSMAAAAQSGTWTGIREMVGNLFTFIEDIGKLFGANWDLSGVRDMMQRNISRTPTTNAFEDIQSAITGDPASVAIAGTAATIGGVSVAGAGYAIVNGIGGNGSGPNNTDSGGGGGGSPSANARSTVVAGGNTDINARNAIEGGSSPRAAAAVADAAGDATRRGFLSDVFSKFGRRLGIIGAVATPFVAVGAAKAAGLSDEEAVDMGVSMVPFSESAQLAAEGDYENAAQSAATEGAGWAGFAAGAGLGATWGAAAGTAVLPVGGTIVGGAVGFVAGGIAGSGIASTATHYAWEAGHFVWSKAADMANGFWGNDEPEIRAEFNTVADNDNGPAPAHRYTVDNTMQLAM